MDPQVSLVIPNFNGERFLPQILPCLLRQTYPHFLLYVVDNCSTDRSVEVVRGFSDPRLKLVLADCHVGIADNFNRGMALVETPYFALCANDELYEPEWLETLVGLMQNQPAAFFAGCKADTADDRGKIYLSFREHYRGLFWPPEEPCLFTPRETLWKLQKTNILVFTTGIFRTEAARAIGALNSNYAYVFDWEYWVRGFLAGYSAVGTHRRLAHYRRHAAMMTVKMESALNGYQEVLDLGCWTAQAAFDAKLVPRAEPEFTTVRNGILSYFGTCLLRGDRATARKLRSFAREKLPGFAGSSFDWLMRLTLCAGRLGGALLRSAEWSYFRYLTCFPPRLPARDEMDAVPARG